MVPKTLQQAADAGAPEQAEGGVAPRPPVVARSCRALVISRDPLERQAVVLRLSSAPEVEPSSAAGFHMAIPMIWQDTPDVIVIGRLTDEDIRRLPELRAQVPHAHVLLLATADDEAEVMRPDARLASGADPLAALAAALGTAAPGAAGSPRSTLPD